MKKIQPARRYNLDEGYPADPGPATGAAPEPARRGFLGALAAGLATLGGGLLVGDKARARQPRSLPGSPQPAPLRRRPPATGPGCPQPTCDTTATLPYRFHFCGGTYGQVVLESTDTRLMATLTQPTETKNLRRLVHRALRKERSCRWLQQSERVSRMERAIATSLHAYYEETLGRALAPLTVQLIFIPPAAPHGRSVRLPGVMRRPRYRACASCNTGGEPQDLAVPLGLTVLGLYALRRRQVTAKSEDDGGNDA